MGVKERYENRNNENKDGSRSGVKQRYMAKEIDGVARDITNQVNSWLGKHNNYLSDYQKRYSGRKYSYEDDYVSDSAEWVNSVQQKKSEFDAEADNIFSYIDQYKGYLNQDWIDQVKYAITNARGTQNQLIASAKKDNEYWSSFGSEDLVKEYGSAEEAYKYYQRADGYGKKYEGLSSEDLQWAAGLLEDGEEKEWVNSYASTVDYNERARLDIDAAQKELDELANAFRRFRELEWSATTEEEKAELEQLRQRYKSSEELWNTITQKSDYLNSSKDVQDTIKEGEKWNAYANMPGFSAASQKGAAIENPTYGDAEGWLQVGNWLAGADDIQNIVTFSRENYNQIMNDVADRVTPVGDPLYIQMTQDEVDLHNAILASEGKETADAYLAFLKPQLQAREGKKTADMITGIDIPVLEDLAVLGYGFGAGVDQWVSGTKQFFTNEKLDPSTTQYANQYIAESLDGKFGQYAHQAATTIGNMAPSILVSSVLGGAGVASAVAQGAGAATLALSAAGGAYSDALSKGYDKASARTYSTLVGASEGLLQYMLGGISSLGGMSGKIATKVAAIDSGLLRTAAKLGLNIGSEILEEELQNYLEPAFRSIIFGEDYDAPTIEELVETAIITALSTGALEGGSTISETRVEQNLKKTYGSSTKELINEGLLSDVNSESYKLAKQYQEQINGHDGKQGKDLTGAQIRQLVEANDAQFAIEDFDSAVETAKDKLIKLGETQNVDKLAELAAKRATGKNLTRAEKSTLANSQYGAQVAKELATPTVETKSGAKPYNATYKSLEERAGKETSFTVSKDGQNTITESGKTIDLSKPKVVDFVQDKETGEIVDMVIEANGEEVNASDISYEDDSKSYLYEAVGKIENITPEDATVIIRDYDPASGLTVSEYLNGMDEAFTYGYHNYSEADLKAGNFAPKLSDTLSNSAYVLGQNARNKSDVDSDAPVVKMRTAAEAKLTAKQKTAQQKARFASKDVEVYFMDGKTVTKFDEHTGKYDDKRMAGVNTAKFLSKLGIGGKYYFYESYVNAEGDRVYKDAYGNEVDAPNGYYKDSDGSIYIDLNAGDYGQGTTLYTLGHELLHFVKDQSKKQFKTLCDLVEEAYSKTDMSMHERVLAKQKFLSDKRGKAVAYTEAYEEVVADAMSTMLSDGTFHEKLMEIKVKDKDLFNTIKRFFQKMIAKFNKAYEELTPDQKDAQDIRAMKDAFDKIQTAFAEALVEASENFQASEGQKNTTEEGGEKMMVRENVVDVNGNMYAKVIKPGLTVYNSVKHKKKDYISHLHKKIFKRKFALNDVNGEQITVEFGKDGEIVQKDGSNNPHPVLGELEATTDRLKMIAIINIKELINNSKPLAPSSENSHQWLDEGGWSDRISYMTDFDVIYPVILHIPKTRDGRYLLYDISVLKKEGTSIDMDATALTAQSARAPASKENGTQSAVEVLEPSGAKISQKKPEVNSESAEALDIEVDAKTESVAPTVMKSERTWTSSDYVQERDKAAKEIAKAIGVTEQKAKDYRECISVV